MGVIITAMKDAQKAEDFSPRDGSQLARDIKRWGGELGGAAAFAAVTRHVVHLAVMACVQPPLQMRLVRGEFGVGDADLLKAELAAPSFDVTGELRPVAWRKILGLLRVFHSRYDNPHA